jgi:hypothetical protein
MNGEIGNFKMKKILIILLCLPMIGFGQCISGDCVNGFGAYKYSGKHKGVKYVGEWKNDKRHGQGTYTVEKGSNKGDKYVGEYKNDKMHGKGTYTFADGESYVGDWRHHQMHGKGTYTFTDGSEKRGIWEYDRLIKSDLVSDIIKKSVEQAVNEWQKKGEFEKTNDYLVRINEKNRTIKIKELQELAIYKLKLEFLNSIDFSNIELGDYDADNETFLLKDNSLGSLVISVPMNEAKMFKQHFSSFSFLNPECVIIDEKFILSYAEIKASENRKDLTHYNYIYNLDNTEDYTITDIDYEFSSIEIDDITSVRKTKSSNISTKKIRIGSSSVNINIPSNKKVRNRYALVIGNEDYTSSQRTLNSEQNVDYAVNDAKVFKEYALKTLGVEDDNMFFLTDATAGKMAQEIDLVSKLVKLDGDKAELIVYYAGHGYPDELTKVPYLIPVDVSSSNLSSAIKLDDLYQKLANTKASKIIIFLDACFTGGGRNLGLVASRGVKVKPKEGILSGNLVVFSASSAEQSSLPYHDEGHGIFTYFLLKKFQEDKRGISLGDLSKYLINEVAKQSLKVNRKEQDPTVNISSEIVNDWRNWKF